MTESTILGKAYVRPIAPVGRALYMPKTSDRGSQIWASDVGFALTYKLRRD